MVAKLSVSVSIMADSTAEDTCGNLLWASSTARMLTGTHTVTLRAIVLKEERWSNFFGGFFSGFSRFFKVRYERETMISYYLKKNI